MKFLVNSLNSDFQYRNDTKVQDLAAGECVTWTKQIKCIFVYWECTVLSRNPSDCVYNILYMNTTL